MQEQFHPFNRKIDFTAPDCTLDGECFPVSRWSSLTPEELERIVGTQGHAGAQGDARRYHWELRIIPVTDLVDSAMDGEPEGGWAAAYLRQLDADQDAVAGGSPEYAGRDAWIRETWLPDTARYPLFVVIEDESYFLWDGHHRLAGAFHYGLQEVWTLVGSPR